MNCPICQKKLELVEQPASSLLNEEQWKAIRCGDWFCRCCPPLLDGDKYRYFWNEDVEIYN